MARPKNAIITEMVRILRALRTVGDDRERRTMLLRDLAIESVDLREHFLTEDGRPDWAGRTWEFRKLYREVYTDAGYEAIEARTTQAAVRYHTGNIVRERVSPAEREALGLSEASPLDRSRTFRERRASLARAADNAADIPEALGVARDILTNITVRLRELDPGEAGQAHEALTEIGTLVRSLTREAARRSKA